jgi:hypothetical protein
MVAEITDDAVRCVRPSQHAWRRCACRHGKLGIPTVLTVIPGVPNGFVGKQAFFDACLTACEKFFAPHVKRQEHR